MRPRDLVLRCYAEEVDGQWCAYCLELCLASQADSLEQAKINLKQMIASYVCDAVAGEDKDYADQLLRRSAPLSQWARYYYMMFVYNCLKLKNDLHHAIFSDIVPLSPAC